MGTVRSRVGRRHPKQVVVERSDRTHDPIILASITRTDDEMEYGQRLHEAADPETPPWRLVVLAADPDPHVRMAVATNPATSSLALLRLQRDADARVRAAVSERSISGRLL